MSGRHKSKLPDESRSREGSRSKSWEHSRSRKQSTSRPREFRDCRPSFSREPPRQFVHTARRFHTPNYITNNIHRRFSMSSPPHHVQNLKRLRQEANKDTHDKYEEEMAGTNKRRPYERRRSSSSDDDDFSQGPSDRGVPPPPPPSGGVKKLTIAEKLLAKQGYQPGKGLGKTGQGIVEPVGLSNQRGRAGLGHESNKAIERDFTALWDESAEDKTVKEVVKWIEANDDTRRDVQEQINESWIELGPCKETIDDETKFVTDYLLSDMLKAKSVFDTLSQRELNDARTRANPYETIGSAFFQNRAAMKTANLDAVFDFSLSKETKESMKKKNPTDPHVAPDNIDRCSEMFYFADVCAGPGGFSEYMLWRKGFANAKGFGFTLVGGNDFKLHLFKASSPYYFEPYYGSAGDGDVTNPQNILDFEDTVMRGTNGKGVHLMMADGGFCVDGKENIQEILSKRIYLCQFLVGLCIVRDGGNFFCKLFDIFTPFSVNLIFLMYSVFERVSIHKPHTSRPANSERYIICEGLRKEDSRAVRLHLMRVNAKLDELETRKQHDIGKEKEMEKSKHYRGDLKKTTAPPQTQDVVSFVPMELMMNDDAFVEYITTSNDRMAYRQRIYLDKYLSFAKNNNQIDRDQGKLRDECLEYWQVPNRVKDRNRKPALNPAEVFNMYTANRKKPFFFQDSDFALRTPSMDYKTHLAALGDRWLQYDEYLCTFVCEKAEPIIIVSTGDAIFKKMPRGDFERLDDKYIRLPPNTIVLGEITKVYDTDQEAARHPIKYHGRKPELESETKMVRIFDAAVIHGDDIAERPYMDRMKAVDKMCLAIKRVHNVIKEGKTNVYVPFVIHAAHRYTLTELYNMRKDFVIVRHRGEDMVTVNEDGFKLHLLGVRGVNMLNCEEGWRMSYSRREKLRYAFCPPPTPSVFERDWCTHAKCNSSFWATTVHKKTQKANQSFMWSWTTRYDNNFGPRVILGNEDSRDGITMKGVINAIISNDKIVKGV